MTPTRFFVLSLLLICLIVIPQFSMSVLHQRSRASGVDSEIRQARSPRNEARLSQNAQIEVDGPDAIEERIRDYLRRHGMDRKFDPNVRLQLVRQEYEKREAEKGRRSSQPGIAGTNWVSLGPTNGAGRMTALAVHPSVAGTVYAGAAGGGVWKSTSGGASWTCLTDSLNDLAVGALAISPSSPGTIYVGTGEGNTNGDAIPGIGLLKSTDGGQTWLFPPSVIATNFCRISIHPSNPQELVIATTSGGFRSTDGGQSWATVISAGYVFDLVRHPSNSQILYSTTEFPTQVLKSTDGGTTWLGKNNGLPVQSLGRLSMTISASNPSVLYIGGAINNTVAHIYKTTDGGDSWSELPDIGNNFYGGQSWYDNTIVVSPFNSNVVIAGGVSYVRSTDGGNTWTNLFTDTFVHVDAHDLQYQGATLYIANDGGIWSSTDNAQSAIDRNANLVTRQYYAVENDPINRNRIYGGTQDNGTGRRPDSAGTNWTDILGGDGFDCVVNPYAPEVFYATVQYGEIHRTRSASSTSNLIENISPHYPSGESASFFTVLKLDPTNPSILYTGSYRVWKSTNAGDSWAPLPTTIDGSWPTYSLEDIAVAGSDSRTLMVTNGINVFRSTDGGTSWANASAGLPICNSIEIDPQNPSIAYASVPSLGSFLDHVYMTTNGGATWVPRGSGLPPFSAHVVRVDPTDANTLFCGTDVGVYRSTDRGSSWTKFGTGLPSVSVYDLKILSDGSALRAATHGRGIWELQIPPNGNNLPTATVTNPPSNLTIPKGTNINFQGAISDPDTGDSLAGTWFFGDTGELIAAAAGASSVPHVFNRTGVFFVSLTARDSHGALGNASRAITVAETFDGCATPMVIPGNGPFPWSVTANKDGATKEASDTQTPCSGNPIAHTLWFEFAPNVSGTYQFSTQSSYFLDVVSLWTGPRCGPHAPVPNGCGLEAITQPVTVSVVAGVTLHVMVSSLFDEDPGTVLLTVTTPTAGTIRIDSVSPPAGRTSGGQLILLTGAFSGLSSVSVGGVSAGFSFTSGTSQITVTTPAHSPGAVNFDLAPSTGGAYSKNNAFAYLPTTFSDDTLVIGVTTARTQHIIELRQAVDALRAVAGLAPAPWTDPGLSPFSSSIKAIHITELRQYLEDAAGRLGYPPGSYTDPGLGSGFVIKRVHIEELRQRVRAIAG